ncbi:hypothetical protein LAZ67_8003129 [Cordylochernes scorpioides]|uniref:Uncharacterized protein n=1 Tax=Cordylochernes scorpioides TaxID=51811 RepID=A0ABY6KS42_9ARAC|nr:hypothetical protein LAZ67_8003129 [Cordylochernes scorpioides]
MYNRSQHYINFILDSEEEFEIISLPHSGGRRSLIPILTPPGTLDESTRSNKKENTSYTPVQRRRGSKIPILSISNNEELQSNIQTSESGDNKLSSPIPRIPNRGKQRLTYFRHKARANDLEKMLMFGKIEGERGRHKVIRPNPNK